MQHSTTACCELLPSKYECFLFFSSLIELPDVNAGTLLAYNPASNSPSDMNNRQFDTDYVQWCCHTPGGDCGNYRQQRPSNDGTDYKPPFLGKNFFVHQVGLTTTKILKNILQILIGDRDDW